MLLGLATCRRLPDWEVDDEPLHEALRRRGVPFERPVWDDPSVDWERFDGVLIRTTWDYTSRRADFVAWAESLGERVHNPGHIVRWNTHKGYLRELEAAGVAIVPTVWLDRGFRGPLPTLDAEEAFLKPAVAANAEGTLRFRPGEPAADRHAARWLETHDMMLQPFLPAVGTRGERSAIVIEGAVGHAVCKVPAPGDFRVQDDWGATDHPHALSPEEAALVERTLTALPPGLLYARIDWLLDDADRPMVNEVELVEPSLFFRHGTGSADRLAEAWLARVRERE